MATLDFGYSFYESNIIGATSGASNSVYSIGGSTFDYLTPDNGYLGTADASNEIWVSRGNTANDNYYVLEFDIRNSSGLDLESVDLSFTYDTNFFEVVDTGNFQILNSFGAFNAVDLDDSSGTARIVGGSGSTFGLGSGIGAGATDGVFRVLLQANDAVIDTTGSAYTGSANFSISVNEFDTVLSSGEGSSFTTESGSGSSTFSLDVAERVSELELSGSTNGALGTQRTTGSTAFTNFVRQGATLSLADVVTLDNDGPADATNYTISMEDASGSNGISATFRADGGTFSTDSILTESLSSTDSVEYDLKINVDTTASVGTVIQSSDYTFTVSDVNGDSSTVTLAGDDAVVTYASDLNYDGRVSMTDLAYLNAGAAATTASIDDVDVDFDGTITIDDLVAMDDQWGSSMHTVGALSETTFTGSDGTTMTLDSTGDASFISQYAAEITNSSTWTDPLTSVGGNPVYYENGTFGDEIGADTGSESYAP